MLASSTRDEVRAFDGELVSSAPVAALPARRRMLHRKRDKPVAYAVFDTLALDGKPTTNLPYVEYLRHA